MTSFVLVNDRGLEDFGGAVIDPFEGWTGMTALSLQTLQLAGQHGLVPSGIGATAALRQLRVGFSLQPPAVIGRRIYLDAVLAQLLGELWVRTYDDPTRFSRCICLEAAVASVGSAFANAELETILTFAAFDPLYYAVEPTPLCIPAGKAVALPCGTAGGVGIFLLDTVVGSTVLSILRKTGAVRQSMTLTGSTSTGHLRVDGVNQNITLVTNAGAESDAYSWKGSTDRYVSWEASDAPLASLSNNALGWLLARKAYLS